MRVWVAGCATGEEAYSIAMLLCEHAERLSEPPRLQVFATDIDEQSIAEAREGVYPRDDRGRCLAGAAAAIFHARSRTLSGAEADSRQGPFRTAQCAEDAPFSRSIWSPAGICSFT